MSLTIPILIIIIKKLPQAMKDEALAPGVDQAQVLDLALAQAVAIADEDEVQTELDTEINIKICNTYSIQPMKK